MEKQVEKTENDRMHLKLLSFEQLKLTPSCELPDYNSVEPGSPLLSSPLHGFLSPPHFGKYPFAPEEETEKTKKRCRRNIGVDSPSFCFT